MSKVSRVAAGFAFGFLTAALGCDGVIGGPAGPSVIPPDSGLATVDDVNRVRVGPARPGPGAPDDPSRSDTRVIRRLSADQFNRSLTVVTGERWSDFGRYAAALGQADLAEVTDEGVAPSVAFAKLVEDAARATCNAAVDRDRNRAAPQRVILRHVTPADDDLPALSANLRYLYMRFLAIHIDDDDDERLVPALSLLMAPPRSGALDEAGRIARWKAVCVGLVTHPDFLTY